MRSRLILKAALLLAFVASPAAAYEDYSKSVRGWDIERAGVYCILERTYEGPGATRLRWIGSALEEKVAVSVTNEKWSARSDTRYDIVISFDDKAFDLQVSGRSSDEGAGFVFVSDPEFEGYFSRAPAIHFFLGGTPMAGLALDGSGAALAEFRRCVDVMHTERAAWLKQYNADEAEKNKPLPGVPIDPFARSGN